MTRILAALAVAGGLFATAAPASAQICLRVICDDRPIVGCFQTDSMYFCI